MCPSYFRNGREALDHQSVNAAREPCAHKQPRLLLAKATKLCFAAFCELPFPAARIARREHRSPQRPLSAMSAGGGCVAEGCSGHVDNIQQNTTPPRWQQAFGKDSHHQADQHKKLAKMDTLGIEPRASRMLSGCDTTTPCALADMSGPKIRCLVPKFLEGMSPRHSVATISR